jgi:hypothetical protein
MNFIGTALIRIFIIIKIAQVIILSRANAFETQYSENAPQRRVSLPNRLKLVLKHP